MSSLLLIAAAAAAVSAAPLPPPEHQVLAHDLLKELVSINTVHEHGTLKAAEAMARRLRAAGFAEEDARVLVIPEHPEQGQLVARLRSPSPKAKPVLWIGHLDVVEAKPEDWTLDPFALT